MSVIFSAAVLFSIFKETVKNGMTLQSTLAQAGGSVKSRGETCRQLRPRQQVGIETNGRRAVGIPSIPHGLTIRVFSQS